MAANVSLETHKNALTFAISYVPYEHKKQQTNNQDEEDEEKEEIALRKTLYYK